MAESKFQEWEVHVQSRDNAPNRFLGTRFDGDGRFLTEAGNTVVRHVVPGSDAEEALVELREGVIDTRRQAHYWPDDLPLDAPIDEATRFLGDRLKGFSEPGDFNMRVVQVTPFGLQLGGVTEADERLARAWRDSLTAPFGYRSPQHDQYKFHTTVAYIKDWLPDEALPVYREAMADLTADFAAAVPLVGLGPPAFCTFKDMNAFPAVRLLAE